MIKNMIFIFCFLFLNFFNVFGQFYPVNYNKYPFINQGLNNLQIYGHKTWNKFFEKLDKQYKDGDKNINIVHFGGSHIQADIWSNRMRENFQHSLPYNNSGRGFFFPFSLINSNSSHVIKTSHSGKWEGFRNSVNYHRGPFGLTGARAELLDDSSIINIWYNHPKNSYNSFQEIDLFFEDSNTNYEIRINLDPSIKIKTKKFDGYIKYKFSSPVDSLSFLIKKKDNLESKFYFFGFRLDNNKNGISYHSIGVNGASVPSYLRCELLEKQLSLINPDLVIFSIGINDAYEEGFSKDFFKKNYDSLIQIVKKSNPNTAILFTTNNDSYYKKEYPNNRVFQAREVMFELTKNKSFAVWDMFEIMGGLNSIKKWETNRLAKEDLIHLNYKGYNLLADLLFEAIMKSYKNHTNKHG